MPHTGRKACPHTSGAAHRSPLAAPPSGRDPDFQRPAKKGHQQNPKNA
jgi:hypothetical protein